MKEILHFSPFLAPITIHPYLSRYVSLRNIIFPVSKDDKIQDARESFACANPRLPRTLRRRTRRKFEEDVIRFIPVKWHHTRQEYGSQNHEACTCETGQKQHVGFARSETTHEESAFFRKWVFPQGRNTLDFQKRRIGMVISRGPSRIVLQQEWKHGGKMNRSEREGRETGKHDTLYFRLILLKADRISRFHSSSRGQCTSACRFLFAIAPFIRGPVFHEIRNLT